MDEDQLAWIAVGVAMAGLVALGALLISYTPEPKGIASARLEGEGSSLHVKGTVKAVSQRGNVTFITISDEEELQVVAFGNATLEKGDRIIAQGRLSEYKGQLELVADMVEVRNGS